MSYIAATPLELKGKNLKVAIVYLHEDDRFVFWLTGVNKSVQKKYLELLAGKDLGELTISRGGPGVDSIVETKMEKKPDFDDFEQLAFEIEESLQLFSKKIIDIL